MNYLLKILCLFFWPTKLHRGEVKSIYTTDVMLYVATTEALVGSIILKTTLMYEMKNILPVLFVLIFVISYCLSFGLAAILFLSNLIAIKRLTFRECLKAVMPARMASAPYMIINTLLNLWGLPLFSLVANAVMLMHATAVLVYYLRNFYFCKRMDIAVLIVVYCTGVAGIMFGARYV